VSHFLWMKNHHYCYITRHCDEASFYNGKLLLSSLSRKRYGSTTINKNRSSVNLLNRWTHLILLNNYFTDSFHHSSLKYLVLSLYQSPYGTLKEYTPMKSALEIHKNLLQNNKGKLQESLQEFLERFKEITNGPMYSNSMCYAIDLHKLSYSYVSDSCRHFTGKTASDFQDMGMDILPEIMVEEDFTCLSTEVFPKMQAAYLQLETSQRKDAIFEIYYRFKNAVTGKITSIVEYSSYARFDARGNPSISTGVVYASPLFINGVRGIVRCTKNNEQETVFDEVCLHQLKNLTEAELKIAELFVNGKSRKEIAAELYISIHTVKTHFKNIYKKLDINRESDLIKYLNSKT